MADLYFGLLMPLIGLMKSEFVLIDQLLKDVRYGFLFEIDRTLIWWIVFMNCMYKCLCQMFLLTGYLGTALKTLEKRFCFISFNALIYFGDIFFIYP